MAKVCPKHDVLGDICWCCEQAKKLAALAPKTTTAAKPTVKVFSNPNA